MLGRAFGPAGAGYEGGAERLAGGVLGGKLGSRLHVLGCFCRYLSGFRAEMSTNEDCYYVCNQMAVSHLRPFW